MRCIFFYLFLCMPSWAGLSPQVEEALRKELPEEVKALGAKVNQKLLTAVQNAVTMDSTLICNGRLTLTSGTPVTTTDVTDATTVYFSPYGGNKISLYNGSTWQLLSFSELSVAVPATTNTPFDIFAYNNSNSVALETTNWSDTTTRATGLVFQDGVLVKSGTSTRRYLGTALTTGVSARTQDSRVKRFLWNYYNRVPRLLYKAGVGASYSYSSTSWRAQAGDAASIVEVMVGYPDTFLELEGALIINQSSGASMIGICENCANTSTGIAGYSNVITGYNRMVARLKSYPAARYHYYTLTESGSGIAGALWYGVEPYGYFYGHING